MKRGGVGSMYARLNLLEAYQLFLSSLERGDTTAAGQVVDAMPTETYSVRDSRLSHLERGFSAVVQVVEKLLPAGARLEVLGKLCASADLHASATGEVARVMYLLGVVSGAEDTHPTEAQEARAAKLEESVHRRLAASGERWSQIDDTVRQDAANVIHAFDEVCRSVGVSPDVVASAHGLSELPLDEFRRVRPAPEDLESWSHLLLMLWFGEVGNVVDDVFPGR